MVLVLVLPRLAKTPIDDVHEQPKHEKHDADREKLEGERDRVIIRIRGRREHCQHDERQRESHAYESSWSSGIGRQRRVGTVIGMGSAS